MSKVKVLYNAECPVCSREIDHYARMSTAQSLPVRFDDLNRPDLLDGWGISAEQAAQRLHVLKDDQVFSGIPAFIVLWQSLPRYRWLAKVVSQPGIYQVANWIYDGMLAPVLYRSHQRRVSKSKCRNGT
ncbi:MAG: DUF393 domain-containing protein [Paracoccaceae bacterium]|nr:DUF393 domain-containing protein [Paracoccaceae bacterium]